MHIYLDVVYAQSRKNVHQKSKPIIFEYYFVLNCDWSIPYRFQLIISFVDAALMQKIIFRF